MNRVVKVLKIGLLSILLLGLSGCINRHTYDVQEGVYSSSSINEEWTEDFIINKIKIELTRITEELFEESQENVFYTDIDVRKYYKITILLFDENETLQQINLVDYHRLDMFNGYGFYFDQDNGRGFLKLVLEVDGDDYDSELPLGTLANGLSITITNSDDENYDFELTLEETVSK